MTRFWDGIRSILRDDRASSAVVVALTMPLVVAGAAFGVETSYWYYKDMQLQAAADAAAYAGALERRAGATKTVAGDAAKTVAIENGFTAANGTATFHTPPLSGAFMTNKAVEIRLEENANRYFSALFVPGKVLLRARAVAKYEDAGSACILALHHSASKAALFSGSSTSKFKECVVMANSLADDAVTVQGAGQLQASCIYSVGGVSVTAGLKLDDCKTSQIGVSPVGDPFATLDPPTLDANALNGNGSELEPGTYSGLNLKDTVNFKPGVYVINGGTFKVNANAKISGTGVMIYLTNGARVDMNGTSTVKLSAATSGPWSGMLFYGDRTDTGGNKNIFNGTADSELTGALYFASQAVDFKGNFSGVDGCTQIVGLTVEWNGNADVSKDCTGHGMKAIPAAELVKLVE